MDRIEEVKKILADYDVLRLTGGEMATEICQLFEPTDVPPIEAERYKANDRMLRALTRGIGAILRGYKQVKKDE